MKTTMQNNTKEPLSFSRELATKVGVKGALIVTVIANQLRDESEIHKGELWVRSTYEELLERLPFMSVPTIRRTIKKLEELDYIRSAKLGKHPMDTAKYYTLNFPKVADQIPQGFLYYV
ncbi:helix-turn-helix domain-containing protein [Bacillus fonticola]|uniref:hypothetical protein n=1 Tax=Bacillus fonticola TaxID=2728853 RepID=UPI001475C32D|nr:hypothetical protein [Bacillus fonticola]